MASTNDSSMLAVHVCPSLHSVGNAPEDVGHSITQFLQCQLTVVILIKHAKRLLRLHPASLSTLALKRLIKIRYIPYLC